MLSAIDFLDDGQKPQSTGQGPFNGCRLLYNQRGEGSCSLLWSNTANSLAQSSQSALSDSMHRLRVSMLVCFILLGFLSFTGAEETETATKEGKGREKREMPNWALWSSDFTGWLQELTAQAGYDRIQDLARTYWAHFPIASYLGYDSPDEDTEESKGVPE
ncbi:otospiralin [Oncorhynchus keta]|uniref:otospiralin n=1 Tax=Oncorhynchus keta TaxID=8018 RepID=UPI0015F889E3|nr:otospiralin [Oncorhynchus keta]